MDSTQIHVSCVERNNTLAMEFDLYSDETARAIGFKEITEQLGLILSLSEAPTYLYRQVKVDSVKVVLGNRIDITLKAFDPRAFEQGATTFPQGRNITMIK